MSHIIVQNPPIHILLGSRRFEHPLTNVLINYFHPVSWVAMASTERVSFCVLGLEVEYIDRESNISK